MFSIGQRVIMFGRTEGTVVDVSRDFLGYVWVVRHDDGYEGEYGTNELTAVK